VSQKSQMSQESQLSNKEEERLAERLDEWIEWHWGESFEPRDIFSDFQWRERATKRAVYRRLRYLAQKDPPILRKRGKMYQVIDREMEIVSWKNADGEKFFPIALPFDLHKFVRLYPKSLMVVGGISGEGKTTFAHNVISLNWCNHRVVLFDSENSAEELKDRFSHYPDYEQWPDDLVRDRSANFADVIEPDAINIIDYLEIQDNFWVVGRYLREIRDALKTGVAIVNLQKGEASNLPLGREFSRHLARVVITIDKGILTIVKAKARAQKNINPVGKKWRFRINGTGTQFEDIQEFWGG